MFGVALTSLVATVGADVLACCRLFRRLGNLRFAWLYVLECQELDPEWRQWKKTGRAHVAFGIQAFKLSKALTNSAPSYYVQVRIVGRGWSG